MRHRDCEGHGCRAGLGVSAACCGVAATKITGLASACDATWRGPAAAIARCKMSPLGCPGFSPRTPRRTTPVSLKARGVVWL